MDDGVSSLSTITAFPSFSDEISFPPTKIRTCRVEKHWVQGYEFEIPVFETPNSARKTVMFRSITKVTKAGNSVFPRLPQGHNMDAETRQQAQQTWYIGTRSLRL